MVVKKLTEKNRKTLERNLDKVFSEYTRLQYSDEDGICTCISCGVKLHYKEMHNAHYIPRATRLYRRDEDNCRPACPSCNVYRTEYHYSMYTKYMIQEYGEKTVELMRQSRKIVFKWSLVELQEKLVMYKDKAKRLLLSKNK